MMTELLNINKKKANQNSKLQKEKVEKIKSSWYYNCKAQYAQNEKYKRKSFKFDSALNK